MRWLAALSVLLLWAASALALPTAALVAAALRALGEPLVREGLFLLHPAGFAAEIHGHCTAAWPAALALAMLAAWPGVPAARKLGVMLASLPLIWCANLARLVGVVLVGVHAPGHFAWVHEGLAPALMLAVVAGCGWFVTRPAMDARATRCAVAGWMSPWPARRRLVGVRAPLSVLALVASLLLIGLAPAARAWPLLPVSASTARLVPTAGPQAVVGDMIIKFRGGEPDAARTAALAGELRVPLRFVQATSGREALVAVDRAALASALAQRAQRESGVARCAALPPPASVLPSQHLEWRLRLQSAATRDAASARLANQLSVAGTAPRFTPGAAADELLMSLDLDALTTTLIERIQQRGDVAYAQANRLLRPMTPPR
jgi:exosortase/archaeosortase family protein